MRRIIRRTITITVSEGWTIIWTDEPANEPDDDLPATSGESNISFQPQKEQTNVPQEFEHPARSEATQPSAPAEASDHDSNGDDDTHGPGRLPANPSIA